jgi:hypothetical protein
MHGNRASSSVSSQRLCFEFLDRAIAIALNKFGNGQQDGPSSLPASSIGTILPNPAPAAHNDPITSSCLLLPRQRSPYVCPFRSATSENQTIRTKSKAIYTLAIQLNSQQFSVCFGFIEQHHVIHSHRKASSIGTNGEEAYNPTQQVTLHRAAQGESFRQCTGTRNFSHARRGCQSRN